MDRSSNPLTEGSADRDYWHYRTLRDFSGSTWQQLMLPFALLASCPDAPPEKSRRWAGWSRRLLARWVTLQHRHGAFDEWYRNEHSYCATAFTTAGAGQSVLLLGDELQSAERDAAVQALIKAGGWLARRENPTVMNQNIAAAVGLQALWRISGDQKWLDAARAKFALLAGKQHAEGWFPEYGGMDLGYSTLALDLLARADAMGAEAAAPMARQLADFLWNCTAPGDGLPGRLGSRGTSHVFPYGAEYFALRFPAAAALASWMRAGHGASKFTGPGQVDDRYFSYFYFPQFAFACLQSPIDLPKAAPPIRPPYVHFEGCGLEIIRQPNRTIFFSRRLGGGVAIQQQGLQTIYRLGYEAYGTDGRRYSTATWTTNPAPPLQIGHACGYFRRMADSLPLRRWMVPFQVFVRLLAISALAELFHRFIKNRMISPKRRLQGIFRRHIELNAQDLVIYDEIELPAETVTSLRVASDLAIHSPSGHFDDCAGERIDIISSRLQDQPTASLVRLEERFGPDNTSPGPCTVGTELQ